MKLVVRFQPLKTLSYTKYPLTQYQQRKADNVSVNDYLRAAAVETRILDNRPYFVLPVCNKESLCVPILYRKTRKISGLPMLATTSQSRFFSLTLRYRVKIQYQIIKKRLNVEPIQAAAHTPAPFVILGLSPPFVV
jgi:hypothetical protein